MVSMFLCDKAILLQNCDFTSWKWVFIKNIFTLRLLFDISKQKLLTSIYG